MFRKSLFLLFLFIHLFGFSQLSEANKAQLRTELANHVNELRISLGLPALIEHDVLQKAAYLHSTYMAKYDMLSHDEKKGSLATPAKRVRKSGSKDFEIIGENILYSEKQEFPLRKKEVAELAKKMFMQWKKSPGHYANMIDPEYVYGDFGFKTQSKKKIVYATQVFGKLGVRIEGQLSNNAFGLRAQQQDCDGLFKNLVNILTNVCNSVVIEDGQAKLYYHDLAYFKRIFSGPKDGLAVDLITKEQLECGQPNQLDLSPVYDGVLIQPRYRKELLDSNEALSEYRLIANLGKIPESFNHKKYLPSIVVIKNGLKCKYLVPANAPSKNYELRPFDPVPYDPKNVSLIHKGVIASEELHYNFKTNIITPINYPKIREKGTGKVHSINIVSYSSIEGDSLKNISLHESRGETIKRHLTGQLKTKGIPITIETYENWAKMYFQLNYLFADSLTLIPKRELRDLIAAGDTTLYWDSLLFDQRKSTANINYYGEISTSTSLKAKTELSLRTALATGNWNLANKAMYEMYKVESIDPELLLSGYVFDAFKAHPELVQNAAALLSRCYDHDIYKSAEFINSWLQREKDLSPTALSNLLHLYALTGVKLLKTWDISAKRLSNVLHPTKVERLIHENIPPELMLNIQLTFLQYYGHTNDAPGINKSFNFIVEYFTDANLPIEDTKNLVKFFNKWSRYDLTNKFLIPMFDADKLDTEATFILAHTLTKYNLSTDEPKYIAIHEKAAELDREQWCQWINEEFQILRNHKIKRAFCALCD